MALPRHAFLTLPLSRATLTHMRRVLALLVAIALSGVCAPLPGYAQEQPGVAITSPATGDVVKGPVVIRGTASTAGFQRYELAFAYDPDPTGTWFSIQGPATTPVDGGVLSQWETGGLTDGSYALRLRVYTGERTFVEAVVRGVRVENQAAATPSPAPSPTAPPAPTATPPLGPTVTAVVVSESVSHESKNPLELSGANAVSFAGTLLRTAPYEAAFWDGVSLSFALFSILGVYLGIKFVVHRWRRDREGKN